MQNHYDIIIIGAGPAGMTAGIYAARAKKKTLILSEGIAGGQISLTHKVANYPGYEEVSGFLLAQNMYKQAKRFGCDIKTNLRISAIDAEAKLKAAEVNDKDRYTADALIIATGGKARELGVPGERELIGRGVSHCATCDGEFFTGKNIIVVGGGNSALEEAVALTQFVNHVEIVHQFDHFQAFESAVKEAAEHPKIDFTLETRITEFIGKESLEKVCLENTNTGKSEIRKIDGVFVFIGYVPQSGIIGEKTKLSEYGEIITDEQLRTELPGVFAAGDVRQKKVRQITTAVSDGTIAALSAIEYIEGK